MGKWSSSTGIFSRSLILELRLSILCVRSRKRTGAGGITFSNCVWGRREGEGVRVLVSCTPMLRLLLNFSILPSGSQGWREFPQGKRGKRRKGEKGKLH